MVFNHCDWLLWYVCHLTSGVKCKNEWWWYYSFLTRFKVYLPVSFRCVQTATNPCQISKAGQVREQPPVSSATDRAFLLVQGLWRQLVWGPRVHVLNHDSVKSISQFHSSRFNHVFQRTFWFKISAVGGCHFFCTVGHGFQADRRREPRFAYVLFWQVWVIYYYTIKVNILLLLCRIESLR